MLRTFRVLGVALAMSLAPVYAQSTYGSIVGTVTDATGATIPAAKVVALETGTNTSKDTIANTHGDFEFLNMLPGRYDITVTAPGFSTFERLGVPLDPRAEVRVNAALQVGQTQTTVEVKGAAPVITTETATVGDVQNNQQIEQLPYNFRALSTTPLNSITTLPGVQVDSGGPTGAAGISIAGNHPAQNEFTIDGFSVTSPRYNGPMTEMYPSTEQISEVRVTSELAPAEYGQMGDITFLGKSGTNQFHGSLFEYFQNDALDAVPDYTNGKPKKRANDFGGSISGPVILPHFNGKNRTFFFFDYEGNRQHSETSDVENVPTATMINGDFSGLCATYNAAGGCTDPNGLQLTNPLTGQPFANNKIPAGMINPVSQKILGLYYPAANLATSGPLDVNNDYAANLPAPITTNLYDVRIDEVISNKQSLFARVSWKHSSLVTPQSLGAQTGPYDTLLDPKSFALSHTYTFRPNLLNEFRFGVNQQTTDYTYPKFPNGAQVISDLGLTNLGPFPSGSGFPEFNFEGSSGVYGTPGGREELLKEHKYQFADNLTWIHGRHTIKMGGDIRQMRSSDYINFIASDNYGVYYFGDNFTGYDFADFLLGLPYESDVANAGPNFDGHARAYGFFGQDSFKVSPKLTVDIGLRYEYHPPFHDDTLQMANFDPRNGAVVVPNQASLALATLPFLQSINACSLATPNPTSYGLFPCTPVLTAQQDGIPSTLRIADKKKFLPRLGIAYRLNDKTVIRTGGGMYDETLLGQIFYSLIGIHTSDYRIYTNSIGSNGQPLFQFPSATSSSPDSVGPAGNAAFGTANQIGMHDPYGIQWNFTVERDLGWSTGLRLTYTGLHSVGLIVSPDLNQLHPQSTAYDPAERPYPNWSVVKTRMNGATSLYNGLETVVTHRFSAGLLFQSSWTWSKNLSDAEGDYPNAGFAGEGGPRVSDHFDVKGDYGDVSYTRRHRWLTTAVYEIPVGRGKRFGPDMNRFADALIGGWRMTHIFVVQSGPFLTPYYSGDNDPSGTDAPDRPSYPHPDRLPASACSNFSSDAKVFQNNCFYYGWPGEIGRFGNSGVGIIRGNGTVLWNAGLSKNFSITERAKLRFESTFTNLPNHVNPDQPNMKVNSSAFGLISAVQTVEGAGARTVQFALRLDF